MEEALEVRLQQIHEGLFFGIDLALHICPSPSPTQVNNAVVREENPSMTSGEVLSEVARRWKAANAETRQLYKTKSVKYLREM